MYITQAASKSRFTYRSPQQGERREAKQSWLFKLNRHINPPDYYNDHSLKPGFQFYLFLAKIRGCQSALLNRSKSQLNSEERGKFQLKHPSLTIPVLLPQTILCLQEGYVLLNSLNRQTQRIQDIKYNVFEKIINDFKSRQIEKISKMKEVSALARCSLDKDNYILNNRLAFLQAQEAVDFLRKEKVGEFGFANFSSSIRGPNNQLNSINIMHQRYIKPANYQANLVRIVMRQNNQIEGYKLTSKQTIFLFDQKKNQYVNNKLLININDTNSYDFIQMSIKSLQSYREALLVLIKFVQKYVSVRITGIVADFIVDYQRRLWLTSVKSFHFDSVHKRTQLAVDSQYLSCTLQCKMCGIYFKNSEVSRVITYKLIFQFIQHLRKRNVDLPSIKTGKSTKPCRVCDLCYDLVVSEQQLIQVQQKFAKLQNTPIKDILTRVPLNLSKPIAKQLFQWRMMVYIIQLKGLSTCTYRDNINFLQYQFGQEHTSFSVDPKEHNEDFLRIKRIRTHYFFSQQPKVQNFLETQQLKFRVTKSRWDDFLGQGVSKTLKSFKNKMDGQRQFNNILIFFHNAEYINIQIYAGLVCDGAYDTQLIKLKADQFEGIYFPETSYYNCNPFPDEWMEIIQSESISVQKKNKKNFKPPLLRNPFPEAWADILNSDIKDQVDHHKIKLKIPRKGPIDPGLPTGTSEAAKMSSSDMI